MCARATKAATPFALPPYSDLLFVPVRYLRKLGEGHGGLYSTGCRSTTKHKGIMKS